MKQPTDVAHAKISTSSTESKLNWVGMENIKSNLGLGTLPLAPCSVSAYVSLSKADQRGIHMSRIYELVSNLFGSNLNSESLLQLLKTMIESQKGLSDSSRLEFNSNILLKRKALVSDKMGYKEYPIVLNAKLTPKGLKTKISVQIEYSSTCPCSAALAREEIANQFELAFQNGNLNLASAKEFLLNEGTWPAWPHSQRSQAIGHFELHPDSPIPDFEALVNKMEFAMQTPTQTGVKRIDELEFAKLNAKNLMFCEDAARRLKAEFRDSPFQDFKFRVRHLESLHSHDVFAESSKLD